MLHKFAPAAILGPAEKFPPGSVEWAERISHRLQIAAVSVNEHTVHHLANTIKTIWSTEPHPWEIFPTDHPFGTPDDYCLAITGHPWNFLVEVVSGFSGDENFNVEKMQASLARAQAKHRTQGAHHKKLKMKPGQTKAYLLRRLARDNPVALADFEAGRFKSVRAAAIAAGIVTPPTPLDQLRRAWAKASASERKKFLKEVV